jgi:hypothetical protein
VNTDTTLSPNLLQPPDILSTTAENCALPSVADIWYQSKGSGRLRAIFAVCFHQGLE